MKSLSPLSPRGQKRPATILRLGILTVDVILRRMIVPLQVGLLHHLTVPPLSNLSKICPYVYLSAIPRVP